jgi:signal transduction histidine kinase
MKNPGQAFLKVDTDYSHGANHVTLREANAHVANTNFVTPRGVVLFKRPGEEPTRPVLKRYFQTFNLFRAPGEDFPCIRMLADPLVKAFRHTREKRLHLRPDGLQKLAIPLRKLHVPLHFLEKSFGLSGHPRHRVLILGIERRCKGHIIPLDPTRLKRLLRFPPTFRQNLIVLITSLLGIVFFTGYEWFRHGLTLPIGVAIALLAAFSAATGMLIYQERQSWLLLRELRSALGKIAPAYTALMGTSDSNGGTQALEREIRALTQRWREFCDHCQRVHDTEMLQAEHLATLGELAAGLAHEIRNPLAGIAGAIEIITKDFPKEHPDREVLEDLRQEARRIEKVLNDLLAYARPKPTQFSRGDLKELVARTLHLARQQTGTKKLEFSIHIPADLPRFRMDSEQLHQVLLNLTLNGIQAIEHEGKVAIEAHVESSEALAHGDLVEITVSDSGQGIPPESLERIFRPFYTTKRGGTGLGLSLCRRIVSQHGGTLTVESELRKGTRFIIRLPLREPVEEFKEVYVK